MSLWDLFSGSTLFPFVVSSPSFSGGSVVPSVRGSRVFGRRGQDRDLLPHLSPWPNVDERFAGHFRFCGRDSACTMWRHFVVHFLFQNGFYVVTFWWRLLSGNVNILMLWLTIYLIIIYPSKNREALRISPRKTILLHAILYYFKEYKKWKAL